MTTWIDSHCHLDLLPTDTYGESWAARLQALSQEPLEHVLWVAVAFAQAEAFLQAAAATPGVSLSCGVHPNEFPENFPSVEQLAQAASAAKIVAIGETGLDYYRSDSQNITQQQAHFRAQIRAARAVKKPLIIHTRDAKDDTLRILREERAWEVGGVFHCFTEDLVMAQQGLDLGFVISFSGIVTFKSAESLRHVAKALPKEAILVETDAPYLSPLPHRGKPNRPGWVAQVGAFLAALREENVEDFAAQTKANFYRTFPLASGKIS
jgi:TatD DNase family protein